VAPRWRDLPHERAVHEDAREQVTSRRSDAPGASSPSGRTSASPQAQLPRPRVHHRHEARLAAVADVDRERVGGVVRALDQRRLQQLAHRQAIARP
jgi:hypothetical protein